MNHLLKTDPEFWGNWAKISENQNPEFVAKSSLCVGVCCFQVCCFTTSVSRKRKAKEYDYYCAI